MRLGWHFAVIFFFFRAAFPGMAAEVTFTKDAAPILYKNCVGCHHPNDIAPMSLLSYKEARPWAKAIRQAVITRTMPPWHADPKYGKFANDSRLSEHDIQTIRDWVDGGSKEGDPRDLPSPPQFSDDWKIGKPDVVIDIGRDYPVSAGGPDEYLYFTVPTHFTEDKWVKAVELRPGNRRVVHHAHVWVADAEKPAEKEKAAEKTGYTKEYFVKDGAVQHINPESPVIDDGCLTDDGAGIPGKELEDGSGPLGSYLPGKAPDVYPPGTAKKIPAGANLRFQVHYSKTTGKPETDRTQVGFVFAGQPPEHPLKRVDISNYFFLLPPGDSNHEVRECHTFKRDVLFLSYVAHMHYRGKDMKFELERPDGTRETLLSVPKYSFNWQTIYRLAEPLAVQTGSRLIVTAHFDNSANNPANPDPAKTVRWGEPSYEEMMDGWVEYIDPPAQKVTAIVNRGK